MKERLLNLRVDFNAKIKPIRPINKGFTLCKCYVLALGKNRNRSNISESVVTDALPSLYNIPVVGHIYVDAEGKYFMGGHDMKLERDKDGKLKFQVLTVPYGVLPETNNINYEEVKEPNGETRTYLTADIILWTGRYPELNETIYDESLFWGQSMEIEATEVSRNKDDKNFVDVNKFTFSGLCLLGKSDDENHHYEPCFPEAKVEPYKFSVDDDFTAKFEDMKKELSLCFNQNSEIKGGDEVEDEKQETTPEADAPTPAPAEETKPEAETPPEPETTGDAEQKDEPPTTEAVFQFAATYSGKREAITAALNGLNKITDDSYLRYYLCDFDDKFVYVERLSANKENPDGKWAKGRMAYTMNADESATINEASFQVMLVKWLTIEESTALDKQREEHSAVILAMKKRDFDSIIESFSDLQDDEDFKKLKGAVMNFSNGDELRKELFALRGMKASPSQELQMMKLPIGETKQKTGKQELHDEFMETYLKKE